jgi:hypothetical protein
LRDGRFAPKAALGRLEIQLPLYHRKQTQLGNRSMSEKCPTRTSILDWRESLLANDAPPLWRAPVDEDGQYSFAVAL